MEISKIDTPSISSSHTSPNKKLIEEMKEEATGNGELLKFQKSFLLREMNISNTNNHFTNLNRTLPPDEGFGSMENLGEEKLTSLMDKYQMMKNHFFQAVWKDIILPNMDSESFYDFISKMEMYELGEKFIPVMSDRSESFKSHQEEVQEMRAQREAGELDEGL